MFNKFPQHSQNGMGGGTGVNDPYQFLNGALNVKGLTQHQLMMGKGAFSAAVGMGKSPQIQSNKLQGLTVKY